jgi:ribonuclease HII
MKNFYQEGALEVGLDEAGRGSLLGRLYVGAVVFPPEAELDPAMVKDSKKFTSRLRRLKARDYILEECLDYSVAYCEPEEIDQSGLMPSLMRTMHRAIRQLDLMPDHLLVDGNYFEPYFHPDRPGFEMIPHTCVVDGDDQYFSIAGGSILAKVAHDEHIQSLVKENPILREYGIERNMGYGSKQHMEAIKEHGKTPFHRHSFGAKKQVECLLPDKKS